MLNLWLLSYRQLAIEAVVTPIYGAGPYGSMYLMPVHMQMTLAYAPSHAGLVLLPADLVLAVTIIFAGQLANCIEPLRLVSLGLAALALSLFLVATDTRATSYLLLIVVAVIGRAGLGFMLPSLSLDAMHGAGFALIAQGSSAVDFLRQLGGATGVSAMDIFLQWRLTTRGIGTAHGAVVDPDARTLAFDETFVFLGTLCALAVLTAWRMRRRTPPSVIPAAQ